MACFCSAWKMWLFPAWHGRALRVLAADKLIVFYRRGQTDTAPRSKRRVFLCHPRLWSGCC